MATAQWENLPADILSKLTKLLNSDVDNLRLRSVCSSWRSSLPPLNKPFSFPLKVPPLCSPSYINAFGNVNGAINGDFVLDEITLYRLSPRNTADDDDSFDGWLFKALSRTNPNTFTLLNPVTMEESRDDPDLPKSVNLLDYGISEICKYHAVNFTGDETLMMYFNYKKAIALWNYVTDCDFAALVLQSSGSLLYWKFGDDAWTQLEIGGLYFLDLIVFDGKCYAVDGDGLLVFFDSEINPKVAVASRVPGYLHISSVYLVNCGSDLYLVTMDSEDLDRFCESLQATDSDLPLYEDSSTPQTELRLRKFNEWNGKWESIEDDLSDVFFILSDSASHSFYAKDFGGFKGNRVYLNSMRFALENQYGGNMIGVYHVEDSEQEICPPSWVYELVQGFS